MFSGNSDLEKAVERAARHGIAFVREEQKQKQKLARVRETGWIIE